MSIKSGKDQSFDIGTIKGSSVIRKIYNNLYPKNARSAPQPKSSYLTYEYKGLRDYELVNRKSSTSLYIGLESTPAMQERLKDIDENGTNSRYYGRIFRPEVRGTTEIRQKREAFIAGAINNDRQFYLLTPIVDLYNPHQKLERLNDQQRELYWLSENGYSFKPHFDKMTQSWMTICNPSAEIKIKPSIKTTPEIDKVSALLQQIYGQYIEAEMAVKENIQVIHKSNPLKRSRDENDGLAKEHAEKKVVLPTSIFGMFADSANSNVILQRDLIQDSDLNQISITEVPASQYSGI